MSTTRWDVSCGCDHHGDHLGCDASCKEYGGGCQHPLGVEVTAATEEEADHHAHGPDCWIQESDSEIEPVVEAGVRKIAALIPWSDELLDDVYPFGCYCRKGAKCSKHLPKRYDL